MEQQQHGESNKFLSRQKGRRRRGEESNNYFFCQVSFPLFLFTFLVFFSRACFPRRREEGREGESGKLMRFFSASAFFLSCTNACVKE